MRLGAVIIDSRQLPEGTIERHMNYLPGFELFHGALYFENSIEGYNATLTNLKFWESIASRFDKVLIFQHDSGLLRTGIEEFFQWDYVGAPWKFQNHGGNGGLSLRNPKTMIKVIKNKPYNPSYGNEDLYICNAMREMGLNLAPRYVCEKFSCETIFKLGTLGYHAINKYLTKQECNKIYTQYEINKT